jgi:hypothetical protein
MHRGGKAGHGRPAFAISKNASALNPEGFAMIGLVSCCGKKVGHRAPAQELYASSLFKKSRAYVEARCDRWFVLSALYGVVAPTEVIDTYDVTLKPRDAAWGRLVVTQLTRLRVHAERFAILAGERYVAPLRGLIDIEEPLKGMQIGQRLAFLSHTQPGASK